MFAAYEARLLESEPGLARIEFALPSDVHNRMQLVIDVERGVVLEQTWLVDGEPTRGEVFEDFVEIDALVWPRVIRSWSTDAGPAAVTRIEVQTLAPEAFELRVQGELARLDESILLGSEVNEVAAAKQAVADGQPKLEDHWRLLRHFASTQRWEQAGVHLEALAALQAGKVGLAPIRLTFLRQQRRNEELRLLLRQVSSSLVESAPDGEYGLALQLLQNTQELNAGNETLAALDDLHPIFQRHPAILDAELPWVERRLQALAQLSRPEELFAARRDALERWPHAARLQTGYAEALAARRQIDEAVTSLDTAELEHGPWTVWERRQLRQSRVQILWNGYRLLQLVELLETWEREEPQELDSSFYDKLLSALVFLDREREAQVRIDAWIALANKSERDSAEQAKLHAAIQHCMGQGHELYKQRMPDADAARLADAARSLAARQEPSYEAGWILQNWRFRETDAGQGVLAELFERVEGGIEELPAATLVQIFGWLRGAGYQPA
jgi:hypothetical protein